MLSSDPFLSKKEIPRTPEHLITDIRTSWRKAIQTEEFSDLSSPTEDPCVESPIEQESAHCSQVDLSMACFLSASHLSEHNESPDARVSPTTSESSPHGQAISSQNFLTSEQKRADKDKISPLKKCMKAKTLGSSLDEKNHKLVSHQLSASRLSESNLFMPVPSLANGSANSTLSWNSSKVIDYCNLSDSHDVIQFGILHETIPDTAGNISLNSTASIDTPDAKPYERKVESNELHLDSPKFGLNAMERKTDLDSIRNRYEALKRTFVTSFSEDRTDYSPLSHVAKQKSESSLPIETRNVFSPLDKGLTLDLEYLTTPSPRDRKLSLPQLISFSPCEDDVGCRTTEDFSDVFESQGPGKINETFDFTHSVSDLQKVTEEGVGQLIIL